MTTLPPPVEATVPKPRVRLAGLDSRAYEHEVDRRALDALEGTPGLEIFVNWYNRHAVERVMRIQYVGSNFQVTPTRIPELHQLLVEVCEGLHLGLVPEFYIQNSESTDALTLGAEHPLIVLSTGCVNDASREELRFILGREVGHIKSRHVFFSNLALLAPDIGEALSAATLGLTGVISFGLKATLQRWLRMSQFTADRAGLLACQDLGTAMNVQMKLAGVPKTYRGQVTTEQFMAQARDFEDFDVSLGGRFLKLLSLLEKEHPWAIVRASELLKWVEAGDYARILATFVERPAVGASARETSPARPPYCTACGASLRGAERFCMNCGAPIHTPAEAPAPGP